MSSFILFFSRLIKSIHYQFNVIKRILDWTIILYLVVPSLVIFSFLYHSWWLAPPVWMERISLTFGLFLLYCFCWTGKIRTFALEADKVFLIRNTSLFSGMKKWGYLYSCFIHLVETAILLCLSLPYFLVISHWNVIQIIQLFFFVSIFKLWIIHFKLIFSHMKNKVIRITCRIIGFCTGYFIWDLVNFSNNFLFLLIILMFIFHPLVYLNKLKRTNSFDRDVEVEKRAKLAYTSLILQFSMQVEKTSYSTRKTPFLNRSSRRIFRKRTAVKGFLELFIKVFIRNSSYWISYVQITASISTAIFLLPAVWLRISVFFVLLLFLTIWSRAVWAKIMNVVPLLNVYKEDQSFYLAKKWAISLLTSLALMVAVISFYMRLHFF
ncbi:ABC transporter permease [Niallia sp. 03133]|uniref:ABC transporter permease n=1 Tax=Niallia sp. 03133 TaxID=3458060 RepID=UPI00404416CB